MLKLHGRVVPIQIAERKVSALWRITTNARLPMVVRKQRAYLSASGDVPSGFGCYLLGQDVCAPAALPPGAAVLRLPPGFDYLRDDDIVAVRGVKPTVRVLWRAASPHNSLLLTERCNNYCLMCSQPPKHINDDWLMDEAERLIPLIPRSATEIGFTGGEPTLYGERLVGLLRLAKHYLPETAVHVLSNGRGFADAAFSREWAGVAHPDVMVGIPIYSDDPARHDYVVQALGGFDEAVRGILNLKRLKQKVEIRVVLHRQTIDRLPALAQWIARNLVFADHVALMGLEMMGFARANIDDLWVDPMHYKDVLSEAVHTLQAYRIPTSVYNHPLCVVNADVYPAYRKSISDWKNEYLEACDSCTRRAQCGGFFSSSALYRHSDHIRPFLE